MPLPKLKSTVVAAGVAGVAIGAAVGYFLFQRRKSRIFEETDEGIGDVDSIVSEEEIERQILPMREVQCSEVNHMTSQSMTSQSPMTSPKTPKQTTNIFESTPNKLDDVEITDAEIKPRLAKIVVLGLEGCGKSTLLNVLAKRPEEGYSPTQGFNVVQIQSGEYSLSVMEVGGGPSTRRYWSHFTSDMDLLIYVVDGSDKNNFNESKSELMKVLAESTNQEPCLLISNKQDLENAEKCSSIFSSKDLKEIGRKTSGNITILDATCCINGGEGMSFRGTVISIILSLLNEQQT
ncbi:uncharacterized protein LOC100175361 [Ciona intestinalis]